MTLATDNLIGLASACCYEPVSSYLHVVGAVWFAALANRLLAKGDGRALRTVALAIYATSCILLLTVSSLYHWFSPGVERSLMRRLDLAAIFLLIAGTYTPLCTILYRGITRWGSLGIIWSIALFGIAMRAFSVDAIPERWGTFVFLGFGWLGAIFAAELWHRLGFAFVRDLIYGGLAYTFGVVVLHCKYLVLIPGVITPHELWHIAVLIGIGFHWRFIEEMARLTSSREAKLLPSATNIVPSYYSAKSSL